MSNLALVPEWSPWQKIARWAATHGRIVEGPRDVSVWWRKTGAGVVSLTLHNATGTWSTWVNLTPDEALRLANNLISAVRKADQAGLE